MGPGASGASDDAASSSVPACQVARRPPVRWLQPSVWRRRCAEAAKALSLPQNPLIVRSLGGQVRFSPPSSGHEGYVASRRAESESSMFPGGLCFPSWTILPGPRFKWTHACGHMPPHHFTMWFMPLTLPLDLPFSHPRIGIESDSTAGQGSLC